jgi:hypothetical protein
MHVAGMAPLFIYQRAGNKASSNSHRGSQEECKGLIIYGLHHLIITHMQAPLQTGNTFGKNPLHIIFDYIWPYLVLVGMIAFTRWVCQGCTTLQCALKICHPRCICRGSFKG